MRKRYSFSSRHTGQAKDPKNYLKQKSKFPEVAKNVLAEADIILQVLDARFVKDTRNKELEKYLEEKNKILLNAINKSDLTKKKTLMSKAHAVSCKKRSGISSLREKIKMLSSSVKKEKVTVGVMGYPNTGKSSLINLLIGKRSAPAASQPGFTKGMQKLKLAKGIVLIDTPGVIPRFEYSNIENLKITKHAKIGARSYSKVKNPEQIIAILMKDFPKKIENHYKINAKNNSEILMEELGEKLNILKKGGVVDFDKTARKILRDWQEGKIKI